MPRSVLGVPFQDFNAASLRGTARPANSYRLVGPVDECRHTLRTILITSDSARQAYAVVEEDDHSIDLKSARADPDARLIIKVKASGGDYATIAAAMR